MTDPTSVTFDLIIIGAGINGAGIARDAALRGLKVLLLDKGDVGSGTSSWSTRLIHGGLRYLEYGEFGLVRESLRERETLLRIAPHLVRPLPLLIPIYQGARRGRLLMRAGMLAYDLLSLGKSVPHHKMLSRGQALERVSGLNPDGLTGAAEYYDAQVEFAERLVVENVVSAIEHGATTITYARVEGFIVDDNGLQGVEFVNKSDGARSAVRATLVINASGPWVDQVLEAGNGAQRLIGGTKGSHLIVPAFAGAPPTAIYVEAKTDQRPFFIIPWNGNFLIGTTDTRYEGDLDNLQIDVDEIDYLLRETNTVIPRANLTRDNILYTYSGVRPLPFTDQTAERGITRRHFIRRHPRFENLLSVVGGKLTTYRSLAEESVDLVLRKLGKDNSQSSTASAGLPGAAGNFAVFGEQFKRDCGLPLRTGEHLLRVYGTRATNVMRMAAEDASLLEIFDEETGAIAAEVVYAFEHEFAATLVDCLLRRTMVGLNSSLGFGAVESAAKVAQKHLGWSENKTDDEAQAYRKIVERFQL
ncbi:MAG: glycerol-3-phosphate dehydrogenase [Pyrinomonadaceae bacterium]